MDTGEISEELLDPFIQEGWTAEFPEAAVRILGFFRIGQFFAPFLEAIDYPQHKGGSPA